MTWVSGIRTWLYRESILPSVKLGMPTISVGNLTLGGTGKSPVVDAILTQAEAKGLKGGVLTRGYGRRNNKGFPIIDEHAMVTEAGDEPLWLARRHPKSLVGVGSNRIEVAKKMGNIDFFLLDDGFQHLQIKRDLDIVCIDSTQPLSHYYVVPWGRAREPFSALKRAHIVILTRANLVSRATVDTLTKEIGKHPLVIESHLHSDGAYDLLKGSKVDLKGHKIYLTSAIGNPRSFETLVRGEGQTVVGHDVRRDHYDYSLSCLKQIFSQAKKAQGTMILVTEKDAVKWRALVREIEPSPPVCELRTTLTFSPPLPEIYDLACKYFH